MFIFQWYTNSLRNPPFSETCSHLSIHSHRWKRYMYHYVHKHDGHKHSPMHSSPLTMSHGTMPITTMWCHGARSSRNSTVTGSPQSDLLPLLWGLPCPATGKHRSLTQVSVHCFSCNVISSPETSKWTLAKKPVVNEYHCCPPPLLCQCQHPSCSSNVYL